MKKKFDGFTLYACFGRYSGFHVLHSEYEIRLILGFVSLAVLFFDIEMKLSTILFQMQALQSALKGIGVKYEKSE